MDKEKGELYKQLGAMFIISAVLCATGVLGANALLEQPVDWSNASVEDYMAEGLAVTGVLSGLVAGISGVMIAGFGLSHGSYSLGRWLARGK